MPFSSHLARGCSPADVAHRVARVEGGGGGLPPEWFLGAVGAGGLTGREGTWVSRPPLVWSTALRWPDVRVPSGNLHKPCPSEAG